MSRICGFVLAIMCATNVYAQDPVITYPSGLYAVGFTVPSSFFGPFIVIQTANSVTIQWNQGPSPTPNPPVPVPPAPTPAPIPVLTGHVWAMAIYDPSVTLPPAQQAALVSPTLQALSLLQDVDFQPHSLSDSTIASWVSRIVGKTPVLMFIQRSQTGQGVLAGQTPMPANETEILAMINKVRGK